MTALRIVWLGCVLVGMGTRAAADDPPPMKKVAPPPKEEPDPFPPYKPSKPAPPKKLTEQYKDLLPITIEALKDENLDIRLNAMKTLMNLGRDAVPALVEVLKGKDPDLRIWAALLLGNLGAEAKDALPVLLVLFKDKNENREVRFLVSRAITNIVESAP